MSAPTNSVGTGNIAGSGGAGGEPGLTPEAMKKYKAGNQRGAPTLMKRKSFKEFVKDA